MIQYVSNKGGGKPVDFETAILTGRPSDGGLYVPTTIPKVTASQLQSWKGLNYTDLAYEVLALFIDESIISERDLRNLLEQSFRTFFHPEKIPFYKLSSGNDIFIQELFYGPTLSFKDVAMGFVVNLFHYFLKRKGEKMTLAVVTSGDTGPAAAYASIDKETLNTWVLYPAGYITEEQERQMTTITAPNVHAVRVHDCPSGSDDLDELVSELFADQAFKEEVKLSSVNSINWGRIMMQTVHYFYGYLQTADRIGETINFSVPSGAFGNLCAGSLAREMGLPVGKFIIANNHNTCLKRLFSEGIYLKEKVINTLSSAIDISLPMNFWRHLHFINAYAAHQISEWMEEAEKTNTVVFDQDTHKTFSRGFLTASITDEKTLDTIRGIYEAESYLLDPHAAVAVAAAWQLKSETGNGTKTLCLATAHPAKFPDVIRQALNTEKLPPEAIHHSIESARDLCQRIYDCQYENMRITITNTMKRLAKRND